MSSSATPTTEAALLKEYLLSSSLHHSVSLEQFKSFFPSKYHASPGLRRLHHAFKQHHQKLRSQVKRNIEHEYGGGGTQEGATPADNITTPLFIATREFGNHERQLQAKLTALQVEHANTMRQLRDLEAKLQRVVVGATDMTPSATTTTTRHRNTTHLQPKPLQPNGAMKAVARLHACTSAAEE
ncbi:hypothetical protein QOT17_001468 [Balamuthia mandrillaris]